MIGYLDCSSGVSGDKFLGALLDIGASTGDFTPEHLRAILGGLTPEAQLVTERVKSHGIAAVSVRVEQREQPTSRTWTDIRRMIASAELPGPVRDDSIAVFQALASAEAAAHGCAEEDVHFHEVGALDSILDVVGVCAGLEALGVERLVVSAVATGWGTVETSHGVLPVPAPATARLLIGTPLVAGAPRPDGSAAGELTTPTGAALVSALGSQFGPCPPMTPRLVGYGAGTRDIGNPNVCRLTIGDEPSTQPTMSEEDVALLESNIDHISPEAASFAAEQLLAEGALDVWQIPITMKKGRAGFVLSLLVAKDAAEHFAERTVALTGTLGVRMTMIPRLVAVREVRVAETPHGAVTFKVGPEGASPRIRPEHDDVARIARLTGRPYGEIAAELVESVESDASAE